MHGAITERKLFDPRDIDGCRCWLRSDLGLTVSSPNKVLLWKNQVSGVSADGTAVSGKEPTLQAGTNALPSIRFGGSHAFTWALEQKGPAALACAFKFSSETQSGFSMFTFRSVVTSLFTEVLFDIGFGYYNPSLLHDYPAATLPSTVGAFNVAMGTTRNHVHLHNYIGGTIDEPANYTIARDGLEGVVSLTGPTFRVDTDPGSIGSRVDNVGGLVFPFIGDMYEVVVYNRALTAQEKIDLYGYMKARYSTA